VRDQTQEHYDRLAPAYDQNWAYSPEFLKWMSACILDRLRVDVGDRVLDMGCGTGLYARRLAERAGLVMCVDPSARMLEQIPDDRRLVPVQASAEELVVGSPLLPMNQFEAILVKEAIHHVTDRPAVIVQLARLLAPGGRLLVVSCRRRLTTRCFRRRMIGLLSSSLIPKRSPRRWLMPV
jgi:ubiquinone/menaquinone biosynthesis C-methylase UbiE